MGVPEGHTIHRKVVDQSPSLVGHPLRATSPNHRFDSGARAVDARTLLRMDAWGKHLFYFFGDRRVLHVHLGLEGRFHGSPWKGSWLRLAAEDFAVDLTRPRICELIDEVHQRQIVDRLGPDPIRTADDGGVVLPRLAGYEGPIGAALLDQAVVAGIGNIYRAEVLHAARVHPDRPAAAVTGAEWQAIWAASVRLLRAGVKAEPRPVVYRRRRCAYCGAPVRSWQILNREVWACEQCQPPPTGVARPTPRSLR